MNEHTQQIAAELWLEPRWVDAAFELIDAGNTFRDFIRVNKEAQQLIKQTIQNCVGVRCGIGPYEPPKTEGPSGAQLLDDTLKTLKQQGVPVIYHDKT